MLNESRLPPLAVGSGGRTKTAVQELRFVTAAAREERRGRRIRRVKGTGWGRLTGLRPDRDVQRAAGHTSQWPCGERKD